MRIASGTTVLFAILVLGAGCAPGHRLAEVQLQSQSVAVMAPITPEGGLVSGPWPLHIRGAASTQARRVYDASRSADARLQEAARQVDVSEVVARRALAGASRALGFRPAGDPAAAEYVLDVRLLDFALRARSFNGTVSLVTSADVRLIRAASGEVMWERRLRTRDAVSAEMLGFVDDHGRVTPQYLTRLSTEQMTIGLERLALVAADRLAASFQAAYTASRR
jgi:hypothetical protein